MSTSWSPMENCSWPQNGHPRTDFFSVSVFATNSLSAVDNLPDSSGINRPLRRATVCLIKTLRQVARQRVPTRVRRADDTYKAVRFPYGVDIINGLRFCRGRTCAQPATRVAVGVDRFERWYPMWRPSHVCTATEPFGGR